MYDFFKGNIIHSELTKMTVLCGAIGYALEGPLDVVTQFAKEKECKIWVHTHFSQDQMRLYGFKDIESREVFRKIISISGVGPKLGITILSSLSHDEFAKILTNNDIKSLVAIPGVGKKTAERLILELKDKFKLSIESDNQSNGQVIDIRRLETHLIAALEDLGFKNQVSKKAVEATLKNQSNEDLEKDWSGNPVEFSILVKEALKKATALG